MLTFQKCCLVLGLGGRNVNSRDSIKRNVGIKMGLNLGMSGADGWPVPLAKSCSCALCHVVSSFQGQKDACISGSFSGS